jgi:hypothetical protein
MCALGICFSIFFSTLVIFHSYSYLPNLLDLMVKNLVLHSSENEFSASVGVGWTYDVPRLLYQHICRSFLLVLGEKMRSTPNFDVNAVTAQSGYDPYSMLEFNDVLAKVYVSFVGRALEGEKPIVYKTIASRRNYCVGEYFIFEYNENEAPNQNPVVPAALQDNEINAGAFPDLFWPEICTAQHVVDEEGHRLCYSIMIRVVLVGAILLKAKPELLSAQNAKVKVTAEFLRKQLGKLITPRHRLSAFFRDFKSFREFVKNSRTNHWRFSEYPHYPRLSETKKIQLRIIVDLCRDFQLDTKGDQFSDDLEGEISQVIARRVLNPIISMGLKAMNAEYVDYILRIKRQYQNTLLTTFNADNEDDGEESYHEVATRLGKQYRDGSLEFV